MHQVLPLHRSDSMHQVLPLPTGRDVPVVLIGILSKAVGCQGGFVCGPRVLIEHMVNRCRAFIFSAGLSPALGWACSRGIEILSKHKPRRDALAANASLLRSHLAAYIRQDRQPATPITP